MLPLDLLTWAGAYAQTHLSSRGPAAAYRSLQTRPEGMHRELVYYGRIDLS